MELTIDDCMALAARESATEPELRAAVCVAVGQALHHRYEANGYNEAAEVARRDADRFLADWHSAKRERDAALAELKAARQSADEAREFLRIARDDAEMFARQRDEARSRAEDAVREREAFSLRLSAAEHARDEALARPTYEARTTAPTDAEIAAHSATGGFWRWARQMRLSSGELVTRDMVHDGELITAVRDGDAKLGVVRRWLPLGADGLPCAWPGASEPESP